MKPSPLLALLAVGLGAFLAAGWLRWRGAPPVPVAEAEGPVVPEARSAERHPFAPGSGSAAPRPGSLSAKPGPSVWVELNNEATTDLAAGDLALAVEKLERCLAAEPENTIYAGNLAESLVRLARAEHDRGQLASAIEHLARAVELGREREDAEVLARILERWRREFELASDDWTEGSSRFELTYDTDREDILHHSHEILELLERAYDDLVLWFGADPLAAAPVTRVVLYEPEDFDRLTGLGDWAAGVFDGVVRISVRDLAGSQDWRSVLRHELAHAFVQGLAGRNVPGWLNEGLAQSLEGRPDESARLRELLRGQELFALEELTGSLTSWTDSAAIGRAYAESLLFVDYLRANYGDEALRRMLAAIPTDQTPALAFQAFTSVPLAVVFEDWRASLER